MQQPSNAPAAPALGSATTSSAPAPAGPEAFAHWLHSCGQDPWSQLTPQAAEPYRFIWGAWLKYLAAESAPSDAPNVRHAWQQASATQVLQFLNSATRAQKQQDLPSAITRRRYWRVLDRIYEHALWQGWVAHNPVDGVTAQDRPPSEDPKGAILAPPIWRALLQQIPPAADLISARDRAVLLLLVHTGITSEEVRGLQLDDLVWPAADPDGSASDKEDGKSGDDILAPATPQTAHRGPPQAIHIVGLRAMQSRTLPLAPIAAAALHSWLGYRAGYASMQGQPALFCSRKAPQLSTHTVLHVVSKTIQAAAEARRLQLPPRMGPQAIRNTVIVHWLQSGVAIPVVLERAGLKTPHALLHLKDYGWGDASQ